MTASRWNFNYTIVPSLTLSVEGERRQERATGTENSVMLRGALHW